MLLIRTSINNLLPPIFLVGSPSALIVIITTQPHLLLVNFLNHQTFTLILIEHFQLLWVALLARIKPNTSEVV